MAQLHVKVPISIQACLPSYIGKQVFEKQEITETVVQGRDFSSEAFDILTDCHFFAKTG